MFLGGIEKQHRAVMSSANLRELIPLKSSGGIEAN